MKHDFRPDYVKIASFLYLDEYRRRFGKDTSGVLFNKYMTLLYKGIKENLSIDIGLPHCWYRWGDIVVTQSMPYLQFNHSDLNETTVVFAGREPMIPSDDRVVDLCRDYLKEFLSEFGQGKEGVESAVDEVYTNAPYPFQNEYRKLRESLDISRSNQPYTNMDDYISTLFDKAMSVFPEDFSEMDDDKGDFIAVFKESLREGAGITDLFDLCEDFWFHFCYRLRIRCNENVDRETILHWQEGLISEDRRYRRSLENSA